MFPSRYFPPSYFSESYFAKVGGTPPSPFGGQTRVVVNGIERTGYLHNESTMSWNLMRGARGTCQLPFIVDPGNTFAPQVGESIEIYDPSTLRVWAGSTIGASIRWIGNSGLHVITLTGVSLEALADTAEIDKVKYGPGAPPGTPVEAALIALDLLDRADVPISAGTVAGSSVAIESLEVTNVAQGWTTLALEAGMVWYVDPADRTFCFHSPTARTAAWTLESADVLWETIEWTQDQADQRNVQVLQLPLVARVPITATFTGDDSTTDFALPIIPEAVIRVSVTPGAGSRTVSWAPAGDTVVISPAPSAGSSVVIQYLDNGTIVRGAGNGARRYTLTRSFTEAGGVQEAEAMLATYAMLPSKLSFQTDRPGLSIGRALTVALDLPLESGAVLNGTWLINEVSAIKVPGMSTLPEPYGHFRYTIRAVNAAATAIFQGDGTTTDFTLPEEPTSATGRVTAPGEFEVAFSGAGVTVTPPPPEGSALVVNYTGQATPDVLTFTNIWDSLSQTGQQSPSTIGPTPTEEGGGITEPPVYLGTLRLRDLTVGDDIADHELVYHSGTAYRVIATLRKDITADLVVRINKGPTGGSPSMAELITVTIPAGTPVLTVIEILAGSGSPPAMMDGPGSPPSATPFLDKEIMTADILASDGSKDKNGILTLDVEWRLV